MKLNLLNILGVSSMLIIFICMAYLFYLIVEPFKIPTITPSKIPILNEGKKIPQGGLLSTDLNYCIYKQVPTTTTRRIEELRTNRVYFFTTSVSSPKKGCNRITVRAALPGDIPPGHYKIITTGTYVVNHLKTVSATFESEIFDIIEK